MQFRNAASGQRRGGKRWSARLSPATMEFGIPAALPNCYGPRTRGINN